MDFVDSALGTQAFEQIFIYDAAYCSQPHTFLSAHATSFQVDELIAQLNIYQMLHVHTT